MLLHQSGAQISSEWRGTYIRNAALFLLCVQGFFCAPLPWCVDDEFIRLLTNDWVVQVPFRLLKKFHNVQQRLVRELEKKFQGRDVVIIGNRRIMPPPKTGYALARPRSRTLTAVRLPLAFPKFLDTSSIEGRGVLRLLIAAVLHQLHNSYSTAPTYVWFRTVGFVRTQCLINLSGQALVYLRAAVRAYSVASDSLE